MCRHTQAARLPDTRLLTVYNLGSCEILHINSEVATRPFKVSSERQPATTVMYLGNPKQVIFLIVSINYDTTRTTYKSIYHTRDVSIKQKTCWLLAII